MVYSFITVGLLVLALASSQPLWAQMTTSSAAINPIDSQMPSAKIIYQSAFAQYRSWNGESGKAWGKANDEAGRRLTGHAGHRMPKGEDGELNDSPEKSQHMQPSMDHSNHPIE